MDNSRTGVRILVVEDQLGARNLISLGLKHHGYSVDFAEDIAEAGAKLRTAGSRYGAMLIALEPQNGARGIIEYAKQMQPPIPVIGSVENLYDVEEGLPLDDIVVKPITGESLRKAFRKVVARPSEQNATEEAANFAFPSSSWRTEMQSIISHVAAADVPVLVRGETGSGKEVLARQLHALSSRAKKPFLKVNCAALPSELIESELFGYERGAFTGAFKTTPGKFEMADGGTILLDEIGDMDFKLQAKLLQVLQDCEVTRLGSSEPRKVDVRVIAATHCDLELAIEENRFREDLYYRLNIIHIEVPPLRERTDEILPLANFFMRKYVTKSMPAVEITDTLRATLLSHDWPGNIRELENIIRRLLVLRRPDYVAHDIQVRSRRRQDSPSLPTLVAAREPVSVPAAASISRQAFTASAGVASFAQSVPLAVNGYNPRADTAHDDLSVSRSLQQMPKSSVAAKPQPIGINAGAGNWSVLEEVDHARREAETEAILNALNSRLWNRKRAAELLNIDYKALLYKMKKLGIVERAGTAVAT